jgi:hypothetical protein
MNPEIITLAVIVGGAALSICWLRRPTHEERAAVIKVTKAVRSALDELCLNVSVLETQLNECLKAREPEFAALLASTRTQMSSKVERVINKEFLHSAYKSKVRKAWQDEFQSTGLKAFEQIINPKEVEAKLNGIVSRSWEECEQIILGDTSLKGIDIRHEVTDTEAIVGLAKLLSNKRRMKRFLGSHPVILETARKLFIQSRKPRLNLQQRLKVAGLNPKGWVSAFRWPHKIYDLTASSMAEAGGPQIGLKDVVLDGIVLVNIAYFVTHKGAGTLINMALFGVLKDFTFIGDMLWEWIKDWIADEFGDAVLQEVLTILAELATALIVVTAVWRIYRYGRMASKIVAMWNGDKILPGLREKVRLACFTTVEKAVVEARAMCAGHVSNILDNVREQIDILEAEACERQGRAYAA